MTNQNSEAKKNVEIKNPGPLLNLSDKCMNIFPNLFDGFRVIVHKGLSHHFRVTHSIYLSSITPGNYRFGATYVGNKEIGVHEAVPVLLGDIDSSGNMNASIYHLFGSRFKVRFDGQMENRSFVNSQLTAHYFGNTFTASVVLANADIITKSGGLLLQYLQSVTPNLAIGTELAFLRNLVNNKYPEKTIMDVTETQVAVVGRYTSAHSVWSTVLSVNNILLSCYKKASDQIEFGIELNTNFRSNESVGSLAYKIKLQDRGIVFRGCVDTNTNIGSVYEQRICGSPFAFSVSANLNHRTSNFRLGLGFIVE
uniref:Uncharacterized protein n=1 Tax=Cuerna arida TaxID=1464854 RepID=A0A1B6FN05_9HEMI